VKHSTGKPTKAEQARLDAIHAMPCICCHLMGIEQPSKTEAHHIVDKGYRKHSGGHAATLPLCAWHHRGDVLGCGRYADPPTIANVERAIGPSLQGNKKLFVKKFLTERELLAIVDKKLTGDVAA
jgi:hypothetical protein